MSAADFQVRHPGLVWSNPQAGVEVLIRTALLHPRFHTILDACLEFGLEKVQQEWQLLLRDAALETQPIAVETNRILRHIEEGFADAQDEN